MDERSTRVLAVVAVAPRNYGPAGSARLLDVHGVEPDPDRIRLDRLLWDLS